MKTEMLVRFIAHQPDSFLGGSLFGFLLDNKFVSNVADLYELDVQTVMQVTGGMKSAENLINSIENSKKASLDRLVFALGIRGIGQRAAKLLCEKFGSMEAIMEALPLEICSIDVRGNASEGLDINMIDNNSSRTRRRDVSTLSGGERFMASFALAIGLSDYTLQRGGNKQSDMLFVDEGFSSLDSSTFEMALNVIQGISAGRRMIGLVTHIDGIKQYFRESQIYVHKGKAGEGSSRLSVLEEFISRLVRKSTSMQALRYPSDSPRAFVQAFPK